MCGHFILLSFALGILEHVDVLVDALCFSRIPHHLSAEVGKDNGMVIQEVKGPDLGVEGLGILQILTPHLVNEVLKEFDSPLFGRIVALLV